MLMRLIIHAGVDYQINDNPAAYIYIILN